MMSSRITSGSFDLSSLKNHLLAHNEYFDSLVNMIPSLVNVTSATSPEDVEFTSKYLKGISKDSKESKRALQKAAKNSKSEDLDTAVEAKSRIRKREEEAALQTLEVVVGGDKFKQKKEVDCPGYEEVDSSATSRIEQLRAKLRAKIAEKKQHLPTLSLADGADTAGAVSKRAARRAEKLRRVEAAKARKAAATGGKSNVILTSSARSEKNHLVTTVNEDAAENSAKPENDLQGINFGTMAGLDNTPNYMNNKSLANLGKKKSLDRLLQEAEAKRQRLKELKESDDKTAREKASRIEWGDVLREAANTSKQPSDPKLIKKALKRKEKQKASSSKAWEARTKHTEKSMAERQKIRSHNLEKRKLGGSIAANLSKRKIVEELEDHDVGHTKRRRMGPHANKNRAGFEGKKQGYINKSDSNKATDSGKVKSKFQ
jgi:hypothetical protein